MTLFVFTLLFSLSLQLQVLAQAKAATVAELAAYNKPDREKILIEGAKKEGKLLWYTSLAGGPNKEIPIAFEKKYPGIQVEVFRSSSDAIIARVLQEAEAKRYFVDAIETTFPILKIMKENQLLTPYFSPLLAQYDDEIKEKADHGLVYWTSDRESYIGVAYNTNIIKGNAVPQNYGDLLKPELKGKLGFATSDTGTRVIGALLTFKGEEFIQKLKAQDITLHAVSGRAILDMVVSGELGASPTSFLSHSRVSIKKGAPIKWQPMEVVPTNAGGVVLAANAPHPHAALLFNDFLLGPEGQKILADFGLDPAVNKPNFKRWYPEKGKTGTQYDKEATKWEKMLRDLGRK
ncbi:MAG TPA: extracellular solute-binding protein [Candidatus Binatia bacterium]|nr:extracellular solute-binding protein [Candidatus Binatia bacterium]